jgi:hypothetical protein
MNGMAEKKRIHQVFVSSTYRDLVDERLAVIEALLKVDCRPVGMELFPASSEDVWTLIQQSIDECDLYVVVVAGRYGSRTPDGTSWTEREYHYALKKEVPVLAFLHKEPDTLAPEKQEACPDSRKRLEDFRTLLQNNSPGYWGSRDRLALEVSVSVQKLIQQGALTGWVREGGPAEDASRSLSALGQLVAGEKDTGLMPIPDIKTYRYKCAPCESFQYHAVELLYKGENQKNMANHMESVPGDSATGFVLRGRPQKDAWVVFGPYIDLRKPGRYVVGFRVRCTSPTVDPVKPQRVKCNVTSIEPVEDSPSTMTGLRTERTFDLDPRSGYFETLMLQFAYGGQPRLEFRIQPVGSVKAAILVDTISVIRVAD